MKTKCILYVLTLLISISVAADPLALGVLEQPQCRKDLNTMVRLLFIKNGIAWEALDEGDDEHKTLSLARLTWTVAFNGEAIGKIKIRDLDPSNPVRNLWYYARDKLYEPESAGPLPNISNKDKSFAGWCDTPATRPLVLLSQPNYSDPEQWTRFVPPDTLKERLLAPLRLVIGRFNAIRCSADGRSNEPLEYGLSDLVVYHSYRSSSGKTLVSIGINEKIIGFGCDSPPEPEWSGNWFLLDGERIDFLGNQLELVDAGDYDQDGATELLFWHSGYNRDGYVLMYDHLRRKSEYSWGYH